MLYSLFIESFPKPEFLEISMNILPDYDGRDIYIFFFFLIDISYGKSGPRNMDMIIYASYANSIGGDSFYILSCIYLIFIKDELRYTINQNSFQKS